MQATAREASPLSFLRKRFISSRIDVLVADLVLVAAVALPPHLFHFGVATAKTVFMSVCFVPYAGPEGIFPLLVLGCSLNVEMVFYGRFALWCSRSSTAGSYISHVGCRCRSASRPQSQLRDCGTSILERPMHRF
jgi:hypothetical protein